MYIDILEKCATFLDHPVYIIICMDSSAFTTLLGLLTRLILRVVCSCATLVYCG